MLRDRVIVLKAIKYGEADLILTTINRRGSRINFIAKSALKSRKRFGGGVLEPSHYIEVAFKPKSAHKEGPYLLLEAQLLQDFQKLRNDYQKLQTALYLLKLVQMIIKEEDESSEEVFNLLGNGLRLLETETHTSDFRTHFEIKLLGTQGVVDFTDDLSPLLRAPLSERQKVSYSAEQWEFVQHQVKQLLNKFKQDFSVKE